MADQVELLSVAETAQRLHVSTRTIRRRIIDGSIVAHRFGTNIRINAESVMRQLVPTTYCGTKRSEQMAEQEDAPRLHRQLSRNGNWVALINGKEVSTGTSSLEEAERKLGVVARRTRRNTGSSTGRPRLGAWHVLEEPGRGFIVVFYDEHHRRKKHRVPSDLNPPVTTMEQAEAYARDWFMLHEAETEINDVRAVEIEELLTPKPAVASAAPTGKTFREVAQLWTTGELASMYPDHVKAKRSSKTDEKRLARYAYEVIGDIAISEFTGRAGMELVERVSAKMTELNPRLRPATRRHVIQTISRVLSLATFPLKLLEGNPLPHGFIPNQRAKRARVCLFPSEERQLLACTKIPIQWRLLVGILTREGLRLSELTGLTWADVDLQTGTVNLDRNKTDDPRIWALNPSVVEALSRWKKMMSNSALKAKWLIVHPKSGRLFNPDGAARRLRKYARLAGLERTQLYEQSEERIALRVHDMRATFVTISLAQGQSETWVSDRTGHRSSQMLQNYRRVARTYQELNLGPLAPLDQSIPELAELEAK